MKGKIVRYSTRNEGIQNGGRELLYRIRLGTVYIHTSHSVPDSTTRATNLQQTRKQNGTNVNTCIGRYRQWLSVRSVWIEMTARRRVRGRDLQGASFVSGNLSTQTLRGMPNLKQEIRDSGGNGCTLHLSRSLIRRRPLCLVESSKRCRCVLFSFFFSFLYTEFCDVALGCTRDEEYERQMPFKQRRAFRGGVAEESSMIVACTASTPSNLETTSY